MEYATALSIGVLLSCILFGAYLGGVWLLRRISPEFDAKWELRKKRKLDKWSDKERRKRETKAARRLQWAKGNPDNPAAKELLDQEADRVRRGLNLSSAAPANEPLAKLRARLEEDARYEREREERKRQRELEELELLETALAYADTPEGAQHLMNVLLKQSDELRRLDEHMSIIETFMKPENTPESIEWATKYNELKAQHTAIQSVIERIRVALASRENTQQ